MIRTERSESSPSASMGLFATLRASISTKGSSAPISKLPLLLVVLLAGLLFTPASALASPPETPETKPATGETTTTATLHGVLNPLTLTPEPGSYQFSYAPSLTSECTPGTLAPASPVFATGTLAEEVEVTLTGLEPNKEYAFCLIAYSLSFEASLPSAAVPFKTNPAPPTLGVEKTSAVTSTAATLEAELNPNNEATNYIFEYSTTESGGALTGTPVKLTGGPLEGGTVQTATVPKIEGLAPGTTYFYRVVAENAQSVIEATPVQGAVQSFTTVATPKTEAVTAITATTATFNGTLTPLNATVAAEYAFDYNVGSEDCTGAGTTTVASAGTGAGPKAVSTPVIELQPGATYSVCLVSSNAFGSEVDPTVPQVQFKTPAAAPTIEAGSEKVSAETPFEATLEAKVNPDNQSTTYTFAYSTSATGETLNAPVTTLPGAPPAAALEGYGDQTASAPTGHHLTPGTTYHFRVIAENAAHEKTEGILAEFTTPAAVAPAIESETSSALTPEGATLEATINPEYQATTCSFQYSTEESKVTAGEGTSVPCSKALGAGGSPVAGSVAVTGLKLKTPYFFRVLATNATGTTTDSTIEHFETENTVAPTLSAEEATHLTSTAATLQADINPHGAATTCQFEYGTEAGVYPHTVACAPSPGSGTAAVPVSAQAEPLTPNTIYHWRLTATNAAGTTTSVDHTFVYSTTAAELPDRRAYEMVSPPSKNGALIADTFGGFNPGIAEDGSRVIAISIQCFAGSESCTATRQTEGAPFQFTRTSKGWETTPLAPPATEFSENSPLGFDANAGTALFAMPTGPADENEFYARSSEGLFSRIGPAEPLGSTGAAAFSNGGTLSNYGVTADLSHVVWAPTSREGRWPFDNTIGTHQSSYEYVGDGNPQPFLVGVTGEQGSDELISACDGGLGGSTANAPLPNPLSADGRTVYFTTTTDSECETHDVKSPPVAELYARVDGEGPGAHTVAISQPDAPEVAAEGSRGHQSPPDENCTGACREDIESPASPAVNPHWSAAAFRGASEDGSKVFFLDTQRLTDQATQGKGTANNSGSGCFEGSDCNLYLYDSGLPAGHNLIDVSAGSPKPEVLGVTTLSADGSHVYFVARGVLTETERPGCTLEFNHVGVTGAAAEERCKAQPGAENLYVYSEGRIAFVSAADDAADWTVGRGNGFKANVTPDGRFLVFESHGDLTPGTSNAAASTQIFRYDAQTGELVRVSIGEHGFDDGGNGGTGEATIVNPGNSDIVGPIRGDPTMSNDGSYVFFQSPRGLTPHALADVVIGVEHGSPSYAENVYEYRDGHVYLISDGRDVSGAQTVCKNNSLSAVCLLGTDASGHNVFFTTADQLVPKDTDTQLDIYDARICEPESPCIAEPPPPLPPCAGESCHGIPPERSSLLTGGSETLNGAGNAAPPPPTPLKPKTAGQLRAEKLAKALKACKKVKKKSKRKSCEKQARRKYGAKASAKKSSRATNDRRASR